MEKIWLKNYPKGVPAEINPDEYHSINELLSQKVKRFSGLGAFENMGVTLTFSELDQLSDHFAAFLQNDLGLEKGDRIALQMPNILQYPVALFGALKAGLIIVNVNPLYTPREMRHQLQDAGAKAIVIIANFCDKLEKILSETDIKHIVTTELADLFPNPKRIIVNSVVKYIKKMVPHYHLPKAISFRDALRRGKASTLKPVEVSREDIAFLQYTGGTTGIAKGAMLTHRNILANLAQNSAWMSELLVEGKETILTPLPLYHIFSLTVNCLTFMNYGGKNILITNPRDIPDFIKIMRNSHFTAMSALNTLFNALLNHPDFTKIDFSRLKLSVAGGMAMQTSVIKRWTETTKTRLAEGYGLTETSPVVAATPFTGGDQPGTIGMPFPSTDIRIVSEEGKDLGIGEPGELWVKGPQVMKGYWNKPEETAKVMTPDGWFKTGDIATIAEDGFLKIVDRKKDMILVSGFNVYPNEVEDIVAAHPKILEVAAIGIPDEHSGEVVKLFIVKKDPSLTEEEVLAYCKENLTGYKRPKEIEFRTDLPKTNVGKILRKDLR